MKLLSIIIPVFNEENTILELLSRVIKADSVGLKKEIIVVDDGSTDTTVQKLKKLSKETKHDIHVICKPKNYGKGAAVRTGILSSRGDLVIIQDADLEYNPTDYPKLLAPILSGDADIVYGSRFKGDGAHRVLYYWHSVMNNMLTTLSNMLTNINLTDMECCYKVFRGSLIRSIAPKLQSNRFGFEPEVTARCARLPGVRFYEVGIRYYGRTYQEGKHIRWHDGVKAIFEIIWYNVVR